MGHKLLMLTMVLFGCVASSKENIFNDFIGKTEVTIKLSSFGLDSIPADISILKDARKLTIFRNAGWTVYPPLSALPTRLPPFKRLPDSIGELKNLTNLTLVGLDLGELPSSITKLQKLDTLNLIGNKLKVSDELEKLKSLKNLKMLLLFGNQFTTVEVEELRLANPNLVVADI